MKKPVHQLTAEEYLEEIRKVRSNPPSVTYTESRRQYEESMHSYREQTSRSRKPTPGAGQTS